MGEEPERLGEELIVVVAAVIDGAGDAPGVPHLVLLIGHRAELGEDALAGPRLRRDPVVSLEAVAIWVEVDERREVLGLIGPLVQLAGRTSRGSGDS